MREMKDSGNPWVGNIPKNWQIIPLKYIIKYNTSTLTDAMPCDYEFDYVDIGSVTYGKGIEQFQRMEFKDAPSRARRVVECGDVILSTVRTYLKAVAAIPQHDYPIVVSTGFVVMKALDNTDSGFLKYAVQSDSFVSDIEARSYGVSYPAINASDAVKTSIPLPSIDEQKIIAQFLDSKCAEIDALFNDIQSEIDTLEAYKRSVITEAVTKGLDKNVPMKDSGIEWIGMIPEGWKISRLKYVAVCRDSERIPVDKNQRNDGPYPYWGAGSIMDYIDKYIFDDDLVLLGEDGAPFFDNCRDVAHHIEGKCWINNHIHVLQAKSGIMINSFLTYFLNIVDYKSYINGSILNKLTQGNMNEISICLPNIYEQNYIADYLDNKCAEIDSIIAKKQEQLAVLADYKKSIIYEYVTGKKEVPVA